MLGAWFYILLSHVMVQRQGQSQLFKQARHAECQLYFIDILRWIHNQIVHGVLRAGQLLLTKYQIEVHLQAPGDTSGSMLCFSGPFWLKLIMLFYCKVLFFNWMVQ